MAPQMAQPTHSAGQMLAQMSRQNGAPQSVTPASTSSPLHGGPAGGWSGAGAGARPQFNNQVSLHVRIHFLLFVFICIFVQLHSKIAGFFLCDAFMHVNVSHSYI